jgi:thiosulfate reductase cytochrome b subunit
VLVLTGLLYGLFGLLTGHFWRDLLPARTALSWSTLTGRLANHLRLRPPPAAEAWSYNPLQRLSYLCVIFCLFPLIVWSGLAMSPAVASAFPAAVSVLGGQQSARTIHFFVTLLLVLFRLVHIAMVYLAGFRNRMRAMITGRAGTE